MKQNALLYIYILSFLFSCDTAQEENFSGAKNNIPANYASFFKIYKEAGFSVLVTYINPEKTDSVNYVVYAKERPRVDFPAYFIKAPVSRIASLSSVFVGMLNNLQELKSVIAVDNADYIYNAQISKKCKSGSIKQIAKPGQLDIEKTLLVLPQIILCNPSTDKRTTFDERLLKAGIIPVVCVDYYETHPLARAEWIKALALLFNKDSLADSLFEQIKNNYETIKSDAGSYKNNPTVFTELKTGDTWFVSGSKSYIATLLGDAGADYVFKYIQSPGTQSLSMEQVAEKALNADYWINLHTCDTKQDILKIDARYASFKAFKTGNLYNNNAHISATGANAFWEEGLNHPDELLEDLIHIFHPVKNDTFALRYYKQLK